MLRRRRDSDRRRPPNAGRDLFEQLQPFRAEGAFEVGKAGSVAAWTRQALDEAGPDRVSDERKHDRNSAGRLQEQKPQTFAETS
jgi:hypothetical protein